MTRRHSSPAQAPPLEDEDPLQEILLRLSPMPSLLPRASLVCKLWRNILSDPRFLSRFRKHHRNPPLLGFIEGNCEYKEQAFTSILEPPNRIPAACFTLLLSLWREWDFMGCHHGLAVLFKQSGCQTVVFDPLTGQHHRVSSPPEMNLDDGLFWHTPTMLCVNTEEDDHVHGDSFSSPFKLVLVCKGSMQTFVCLYESVSGLWGNVVSTATTFIQPSLSCTSIQVGNALCWVIAGGHILAFDLETQSLVVIEKPTDAHAIGDVRYDCCFQVLRMENPALGLAILSELTVQIWERRSNCDGVVGWVLQKTILLEGLLPRDVGENYSEDEPVVFAGYDDETNMIVLSTMIGYFTLQLDSMLVSHIIKEKSMCFNTLYPYRNFYTAGRTAEWKWLDLELGTREIC